MRRTKKTALVALLTVGLVTSPVVAQARHWGHYHSYYGGHFHHGVPAPLVGLGIAGAVLGTAAIVHSIVNPPVVYYAPPPPPPPPSAYEDGYRRGYDQGRRDSGDDGYRSRDDNPPPDDDY